MELQNLITDLISNSNTQLVLERSTSSCRPFRRFQLWFYSPIYLISKGNFVHSKFQTLVVPIDFRFHPTDHEFCPRLCKIVTKKVVDFQD